VSDIAQRSPDLLGSGPGGQPAGSRFGSLLSRSTAVFLRQREASVLLIAIVISIYFWASSTPDFISHGSFVDIGQYMAPYVIIGIGEVLLMVSGEIDLSVGYVWTFSPFVMHFFIDSGLPTLLAIVVTVLLLSLVGVLNGVVTTVFGVPSLITTLGSGWLVYGYMLTVSNAQQVNLPTSSAGYADWFGAGPWSEIIWASLLVIFFQIILTRTRWGLYTISVGGNLLGAREAGIKVNKIKIGNFVLSAGLGALAGILEAFKNDIIDPSAGQLAVVLVALAGVVIGGTAMLGGSGTMIGAWLGILVLGILQDGFNLRGISSNAFQMILGGAILLAMIANTYIGRLRNAGRVSR
jgi:simple sugar transport system permease protein